MTNPKVSQRGIWHLTLCTLLSSQGSGAPVAFPLLEGFRATVLTYHLQGRCSNRFPPPRALLDGFGRPPDGVSILSLGHVVYKRLRPLGLEDLVPREAGKLFGFPAPLG
jgi:hypothetical protein